MDEDRQLTDEDLKLWYVRWTYYLMFAIFFGFFPLYIVYIVVRMFV